MTMPTFLTNFPIHGLSVSYETVACLRCGRQVAKKVDHKVEDRGGHWYSCSRCNLDVEIYGERMGYGDNLHMWMDVPEGTLAVFAWEKA